MASLRLGNYRDRFPFFELALGVRLGLSGAFDWAERASAMTLLEGHFKPFSVTSLASFGHRRSELAP